ncbi:MAG: hypothetical protein JJU29_01270 [Verrucomicrobia bacterium]|nr:hypothetical protein [Verrucomicrobiota bacterium]
MITGKRQEKVLILCIRQVIGKGLPIQGFRLQVECSYTVRNPTSFGVPDLSGFMPVPSGTGEGEGGGNATLAAPHAPQHRGESPLCRNLIKGLSIYRNEDFLTANRR